MLSSQQQQQQNQQNILANAAERHQKSDCDHSSSSSSRSSSNDNSHSIIISSIHSSNNSHGVINSICSSRCGCGRMNGPGGTERWSQTGCEGRGAPDWAAPALGWPPPPPWWVGQCHPPRPDPEWMPAPLSTTCFPVLIWDHQVVHLGNLV